MTEQPRDRPIDPRDQRRILEALESWAETGEFMALRMRALVYLLADGALRTKAACWLDIEEVVKEPSGQRIVVVQQAVQRPCEGNAYRGRSFLLSDRSRQAIADYLKVARDEGWLKDPGALQGPLWIATHHRGTQQRMSTRTAAQSWQTFLQEHVDDKCEVALDDFVMTGRLAFLKAARMSTDVLSEHAGLTPRAAAYYRDRIQSAPSSTAREVMTQLNKQQRKKKTSG
jgi:integrase